MFISLLLPLSFFLLCLAHKALATTAQGLLSFLLQEWSVNHRQHQLPWAVPRLKSRESVGLPSKGSCQALGKGFTDKGFFSHHLSLELLFVF